MPLWCEGRWWNYKIPQFGYGTGETVKVHTEEHKKDY